MASDTYYLEALSWMLMKPVFLDLVCICPHLFTPNRAKTTGPRLVGRVQCYVPKGMQLLSKYLLEMTFWCQEHSTLPCVLPEINITIHLETQSCPALSSEGQGEGATRSTACPQSCYPAYWTPLMRQHLIFYFYTVETPLVATQEPMSPLGLVNKEGTSFSLVMVSSNNMILSGALLSTS